MVAAGRVWGACHSMRPLSRTLAQGTGVSSSSQPGQTSQASGRGVTQSGWILPSEAQKKGHVWTRMMGYLTSHA